MDAKDRRIAELEAENQALNETISAWFVTREATQDQLGPLLMEAMSGYLRTCRCGGMSRRDSDTVEAAFASFAASFTGDTLFPIIRTLAEKLAGRAADS